MGETATSSDGPSVTVSEPEVRRTILSPDEGSSVHAYPAGRTDAQFLSVPVSTGGTDVASLRFAPVLDGTSRESRTYRHSFSPGSSGRIGLLVPTVRAESGAVEWRPSSDERYRWALPESVVTAVATPPRFEVRQLAVPDSVSRGDPFTARLTVANAGERDGRFLAVVLTEGSSSVPLVETFTVRVPTGETVTRDLSGRPVEVERSSVTAVLDYGIGQRRASFSVTG